MTTAERTHFEKACAGLRALAWKGYQTPLAFLRLPGGDDLLIESISGVKVLDAGSECSHAVTDVVGDLRFAPLWPEFDALRYNTYRDAYEDYV